MTNFCHLHNHSEYSLLDGMSTPEEMAQIVSSNGQTAAAITDHGSMAGVLRFQEAAKKQGVKPIFGIEAYYVPSLISDDLDKKAERFHLILLSKNNEGLYKLFRLNKKAWTTGFYYKPRIEWDDLLHLGGDVVVLSGCMASYLSRLLAAEEYDKAEETAAKFKGVFGDDYYIEIQPWNDGDLNKNLMNLATFMNIPIVGTLDCHYPTKHDRGIEEMLLMMGQMPGLNAARDRYAKEHAKEAKNMADLVDKINCMYPDRFLKFEDIGVYLKSTEEIVETFKQVGLTDQRLFDNTMVIADKCNADIVTKRNLLPKFSKTLNSAYYLRELALFGLEEKGYAKNKEYVERLEEELETVIELGFADYFLIVWDIVKFADRKGIPRGHGRGSVGGSLLAWSLDITKIDSIKHGLLFSRFLNKERVSWPDIDMDFGTKGREAVKAYIREKWGEENVASIATYTEFRPKGLVKDIARVFGVPYNEANALSPLFETLDELKRSEAGRNFLNEYPQTLTVAERLEGRIKGTGIHAAGVVVSSEPLWKVCPVESRTSKGDSDDRTEVIAFDMNMAEEVGLLKFDILGVLALDVVNDCLLKIKERHGVNIESESLGLDDNDVYNDISAGHTIGVFQAEATAYRNLILDMGINCFADLAASNALVRPGAFVTQGDEYLACKNQGRAPSYPHENVRPYLEETFGTIVYQEQLMKVAEHLAGFTQYESDTLRKIIGKKRDAIEFEPFHVKFIEGSQKYVSKETAEKLWDDLETSASYMFNKSHAVGYSMLSYQTAWLKHYYPTEYIWAMLANENDPSNIATYLLEANRLGVEIEGPDVNISGESFTLDGDKIRFGLKNVAGCGPSAIKEIMEKRPFSSLDEMKNKCKRTAVKSTLYDNFEKLNAYSSMNIDSGYDSKRYWLELLNCPIFVEDKFLSNIISRIDDIDIESETLSVVRAMVKTTKRKPNYFRVELEDVSGSVSVFGSLDMSIKARDYIIALVGDKTLHCFAHATTAEDNFDDEFLNFLREMDTSFQMPKVLADKNIGGADDERSLMRVVSYRYFKTKTNKVMGTVWLYDPIGKEFRKYTAFPQSYGRILGDLTPWNWVIIKSSAIRGGGMSIDDMISVKNFCDLKGVSYEDTGL